MRLSPVNFKTALRKEISLSFLFDAHFGGNWGTAYKGFRVVEVMKDNSMVTYIMNPTEKMNEMNYAS